MTVRIVQMKVSNPDRRWRTENYQWYQLGLEDGSAHGSEGGSALGSEDCSALALGSDGVSAVMLR